MSNAATRAPVPSPLPAVPTRNGRSAGMPVFLLALLIGGSLHLGLLILFHFKVAPATAGSAPRPAPFIHFNPDSPALRQQLAQFQFSPEQPYLSAEKSFSAQAQPHTTAPSNPVFDAFTVQPALSEVDFHQPNQAAPVATEPANALKPTQWDLLNSIGQAPTPGAKLQARGAFVRITQLQAALGQTGGDVVELVWPTDLAPPTGNGNWQPVSFLLHFNATGLAGEPVLETGFDPLSQGTAPNDADVNKFLLEKLRDWYTKHPPLPAGFYNAVVGP